MPDADVFIDSSVLIYLHDRREPEKGAIASATLKRIAEEQRAKTNLQVLNEVAHVLLRKKWFDSPATVFSIIDKFGVFGKAPITPEQSSLARLIHVQTAFSWWDSLLLASALDLGCACFLTEDLSDGQRIDLGRGKSLTIVNPFAHSPDQILFSR